MFFLFVFFFFKQKTAYDMRISDWSSDVCSSDLLLPRWRGAAPIQRAIEAGDTGTGVCLMQMEAGLDTGPVLLSQPLDIGADETGGQLHDRLAALGAQVLSDGIGLLRAGMRSVPNPQPAEGVTYAPKLDKAEAKLDWSTPRAEEH